MKPADDAAWLRNVINADLGKRAGILDIHLHDAWPLTGSGHHTGMEADAVLHINIEDFMRSVSPFKQLAISAKTWRHMGHRFEELQEQVQLASMLPWLLHHNRACGWLS